MNTVETAPKTSTDSVGSTYCDDTVPSPLPGGFGKPWPEATCCCISSQQLRTPLKHWPAFGALRGGTGPRVFRVSPLGSISLAGTSFGRSWP